MSKIAHITETRINLAIVADVISTIYPRALKDWADPNIIRMNFARYQGNFSRNIAQISNSARIYLVNQLMLSHKYIIASSGIMYLSYTQGGVAMKFFAIIVSVLFLTFSFCESVKIAQSDWRGSSIMALFETDDEVSPRNRSERRHGRN